MLVGGGAFLQLCVFLCWERNNTGARGGVIKIDKSRKTACQASLMIYIFFLFSLSSLFNKLKRKKRKKKNTTKSRKKKSR